MRPASRDSWKYFSMAALSGRNSLYNQLKACPGGQCEMMVKGLLSVGSMDDQFILLRSQDPNAAQKRVKITQIILFMSVRDKEKEKSRELCK